MADPTTCPHGVTLGQRCFACNSADTLPLTMPDQLSRELAAAREKLAALEVLAKLRAHRLAAELRVGFEGLRDFHAAVAKRGVDLPAEHAELAEVYTLLLELLGGPHG
ncbi:MAG TPA: hypothetical protein VFZ61_03580 [Polyangiales bacterium]